MPTIIDSLVISLGLDPKGFTEGQKAATASMAKTKDAALKQSKELEEANKHFAQSFNTVKRQAAELFALIVGTTSIKQFIADVTTATAALGRLSANVNVNPQELGAWGAAIQRAGGDAAEAAGDFQTLSQQLFDLRQNGKNIPESLQKMGAEARVPIDFSHGLPAYLQSLATAAARLTQLHGGDRSDSFNFLKQAGIGPGMAQVLIDNGAALDTFIGKLKSVAPSDEEIRSSEKLQNSWFTLTQQATALGRALEDPLNKQLTPILDKMSDWIEKNKELVATDVAGWVGKEAQEISALVTNTEALFTVLDKLRKLVVGDTSKVGKAEGGFISKVWEAFSSGKLFDTIAPPVDKAAPAPVMRLWDWIKDNWGVKGAHAGTLDGLTPGRGNSGPHPAAGLFIQGQQVSRGNPMPVTVVAGTETGGGGGLLSWLFGGGSPTSQGGGIASGGGGIIAGAAKSLANHLFGGGNKGIGGWWTPDRVKHASERLQNEAGLSEMGAAGLVARWSGVEAAGGPASVNPSSGAAGINQALGSRKPAGYGSMSFDQQLDYIIKNDLPSEKRAYEQLKNAKTMGDAARGASMYERAEGYNPISGVDNFTSSTPVGKILGMLHGGAHALPHRPVSHTPLSTMSALHPVTTASTSNSMHIDQIHVNAPNATNAHGIADRISDALRSTAMTTTANFGQA